MSSPEFVALRGIPGTVVAAKAQLYEDARKRSLLFFLQSLSLDDGGLPRIARALVQELPKFREQELVDLLIEICINPKLELKFSDSDKSAATTVRLLRELSAFQDCYEANVKSTFILTTIGKEIFDTLDHALAIRKMVVIEGEPGSGKTTAVEAWCAMHQGEARFASLSGITHKTGFFQKLATAIGLAASKRKATDMQVKVESFFRKTRLMLVIDEAHYLWPQHQRSQSSPELIDWVNTALFNQNVPVALICTDQFAKLKTRIEKQTGWTSEQFEHRVKRYKKLTASPTKPDLEAVASRLLAMTWNAREERWNVPAPAPNRDFVKMIVGYALTSKMRLPAVAGTVEEARCQARKAGRDRIIANDIRTALFDYHIPSDQALQNAFRPEQPSIKRHSIVHRSTDPALQRCCNPIAGPLQLVRR